MGTVPSKRMRAIMREGARSFTPDGQPDYMYGGKVLGGEYDRECWLAGWQKAQNQHESKHQHDARQYGDTTECAICGKQWDTNDPDPPPCDGGAGRRVDAYIVTWRRQLGASKRGNSPEA